MRFSEVMGLLGQLLLPFAVLLLAPAIVDLIYGDLHNALVFVGIAVASFVSGLGLRRLRRDHRVDRTEAMAVVASSWLLAALLGAFPYFFQGFSFVDSFFESMSGLTTTGSTIFLADDFTRISKGLMFWRAMTQWLGGMGIIVLFVAVLPALAVAGRQIFFAEAPGPEEESLTPRIRQTASALWKFYIALTVLEAILLRTVGDMDVFESICHALTTMSAGGFSPNGQSLAGYGASSQWIVLIFMLFAGTSFALQYRVWRKPWKLFGDVEFKAYLGIVLCSGLLMAWLIAGSQGHDLEASVRHGFFQSLTIVTTAGYASEDFNLWSDSAKMVLLALMFIGGCAGSAGGGPKVIRVLILVKTLIREIVVALHPRAVRPVRVGRRPIPKETVRSIVGFFIAYFAIFAVVAVAVGIIQDDMSVGVTGSIVTLGNIGPGFGAIGPMETFAGLEALTKTIFIFAMWVGRLEVMTVLVLLHPDVVRTLFRSKRK